jgi:hypothetical protein
MQANSFAVVPWRSQQSRDLNPGWFARNLWIGICAAVFLAVCATLLSTMSVLGAAPRLVCSIPVGGMLGPQYVDTDRVETAPWGPKAFAVDADRTFFVLDTGGRRVISYSSSCGFKAIVPLPAELSGAVDIALTEGGFWFLTIASPDGPSISFMTRSGRLLDRRKVFVEDGEIDVTGIAVSDQGILIERDFGASVEPIPDPDRQSKPRFTRRLHAGIGYGVSIDDVEKGRGTILVGNRSFSIRTVGPLIGLRIVHVGRDGSIFVAVSERAAPIRSQVLRYSRDGRLLGQADAPRDGQIYIDNNISVSKSGEIYIAVGRESRFELQRLIFSAPRRTPISAMARPVESPRPGPTSEIDEVCKIFRPDVMKNAAAFVSNKTTLSEANISGVCEGRDAPRYFKKPGEYTSVPYQWGGGSSVSSFNKQMAKGLAAGDRSVGEVLSCAGGIDCSGFVTRAWGLPGKEGTTTLPKFAYQIGEVGSTAVLRKGDILNWNAKHVLLFVGVNGKSASATVYEATTDNSLDRVVKQVRSLEYIASKKYTPLRYKNLCDFVDASIGCSGYDPTLFVQNAAINFGGGKVIQEASGYDYDGDPLFFNVKGRYNRAKKWLSIDIEVYSDAARSVHARTDRCEGTWDDANSANVFRADCRLVVNTTAGCPVIWAEFSIDETGKQSAPVSKRRLVEVENGGMAARR